MLVVLANKSERECEYVSLGGGKLLVLDAITLFGSELRWPERDNRNKKEYL